jgi:hypothetical protein
MDAEKNVVEAARKVLKLIQPNAVGGFDVTGNLHDELRELMGAIAAYDSAPAPSEDRVREAVRAVFDAIHGEPNVYFPPPDVYARCAAALKPYVTPAPALPAGTVVVSVEMLKKWRERTFGITDHDLMIVRAYVAALRAAWEADPKGKQ